MDFGTSLKVSTSENSNHSGKSQTAQLGEFQARLSLEGQEIVNVKFVRKIAELDELCMKPCYAAKRAAEIRQSTTDSLQFYLDEVKRIERNASKGGAGGLLALLGGLGSASEEGEENTEEEECIRMPKKLLLDKISLDQHNKISLKLSLELETPESKKRNSNSSIQSNKTDTSAKDEASEPKAKKAKTEESKATSSDLEKISILSDESDDKSIESDAATIDKNSVNTDDLVSELMESEEKEVKTDLLSDSESDEKDVKTDLLSDSVLSKPSAKTNEADALSVSKSDDKVNYKSSDAKLESSKKKNSGDKIPSISVGKKQSDADSKDDASSQGRKNSGTSTLSSEDEDPPVISSNKLNREFADLLRQHIDEIVDWCTTIRAWLQSNISRNKNIGGADLKGEIQNEMMIEIQTIEQELLNHKEIMAAYYVARGGILEKYVKAPEFEDYKIFIIDEDEKHWVSLRAILIQMRNQTMSLYDAILKDSDELFSSGTSDKNENYGFGSMY